MACQSLVVVCYESGCCCDLQSEFDEVFSCEVVEEVLISVPQSIPADDLKQWLQKDFIPYIISVLPDGLVCYYPGTLSQLASVLTPYCNIDLVFIKDRNNEEMKGGTTVFTPFCPSLRLSQVFKYTVRHSELADGKSRIPLSSNT